MSLSAGPGILAVHPGALGDVVLFGHLLSAVGGRVTLAAGGEKARLLAAAGVVDAALDFDLLPMHELFGADGEVGRLSGLLGRHERVISCFSTGGADGDRRLAEACGATRADFLHVRPPAEFDGHLTELWRRQLGLGGPVAPAAWRIPAPWRADAAAALGEAGIAADAPHAVLHPGAGGEAKCWALNGFLAVAEGLAERGLEALFVLGPVELDRWAHDGRADCLRRAFPVLEAPPLATLAGVLGGAKLYAGNDSGSSHLAAAVGAPTLAIFGPTRPAHFRPLGRRVEVLAADLSKLDAADVLAAAAAML